MSGALAIAAITEKLRSLLQAGLDIGQFSGDTRVVTQPPDKVQFDSNTPNKINLYLYHTTIDPHWRNMDVPWKAKSGETGGAPLPLDLYYLITAYYGGSENSVDRNNPDNRLYGGHRLLGQAMSTLQDYPVLDTAAVNDALPSADQQDYPYDQIESVRITLHPLSIDDMSKIWTGFQTQYRLSAAYQVSVVLIESGITTRTPLPVLTRGKDDSGPMAQANLLPPYPTLAEIRFDNKQPAIRQNETMTLVGHHLSAEQINVHFTIRSLDLTFDLDVPSGTETELPVTLPDASARWPIGYYTIEVELKRAGEQTRTTNALSFALTPDIVVEKTDQTQPDVNGRVTVSLKVTCKPQIWDGQRVLLLWGDREVSPQNMETPLDGTVAPPQPLPQTDITFVIDDVDIELGFYWVRLRVDSVDSLLIDRTKTPLQFYEAYKVTVS